MRQMAFAAALLTAGAVPATAAPLFDAGGSWTGTGRIAPGAQETLQRGRCQVDISPNSATDVNMTGRCAIAGGARNISLRYVKAGGNAVRAGVWSPSDNVSIQYAGSETADTIRLQTLEPFTVDGISYNSQVTLTFQSDIQFTFQQILQRTGTQKWVLVVDMTFRQ